MAVVSPSRWWAEMNLDARQALADGNYGAAYWLAANNGLAASGQEYADSQFLAGWIALRYLRDAKEALSHFQNLGAAVTRPISKARAYYWEGRAYEAMGEAAQAWRAYHQASQIPETFYGQLALARIDSTPHLRVPDPAVEPGADLRAAYEKEDLTRAIRVLADLERSRLGKLVAGLRGAGRDGLSRSQTCEAALRRPDPDGLPRDRGARGQDAEL